MQLKREISDQLFDEAKRYFPGGVNSPVRAFKSVHGSPLFIKKGDKDRIYDEDGNEFIDFCCSWGPLIHGHNHPRIREAVANTIQHGLSFGTPTRGGVKIGQLITENHSYLEKVRFVCSGTEAVMSAIRLARGYTGKTKILKFDGCYHGHVDSLMVKAGSGLATFGISTSAGIPAALAQETMVLPLNDLAGVEALLAEHHEDLACIIIEPIPANNGLLIQDTSFLVWLRKLCDDYKILLIFDEVISGFRVGFEGAAGHYKVAPDLITFGKILGGGMPVGAFGGKAEIMNFVAPLGPVYQAGTLSANPVAIAAGIASLELCLQSGFYEDLERKTKDFVQQIIQHTTAKGYDFSMQHIGSIFWLNFGLQRVITADQINPDVNSLFKVLHLELLQKGIYLGPSGYEVGFISSAHTQESLEMTVNAMCDCLDTLYR